MFFLRSDKGDVRYFFNIDKLQIGRRGCDITITDDQSVSRRHAELSLQAEKVYLTDLGSKYGTYINKDTQLVANTAVQVHPKNEIRIGVFQSIYTLEQINVVTTGSNLKKTEKAALTETLKSINGSVVADWSQDCINVTVSKILLTPKVLCALIVGKPVVTLEYWEKFAENVTKNVPMPDPKDYLPEVGEAMLSTNAFSMEYNPARKKLFQNKVFLFVDDNFKTKMEDVVRLAGGRCISFAHDPITPDTINKSPYEYIIIQDDTTSRTPNAAFNKIIEHTKNCGKRTIPIQEIALALISCSCEKDCNPSFNRAKHLLTKPDATQSTAELLALDSQQDTQEQTWMKGEVVVPATLDADVDLSEKIIGKRPTSPTQSVRPKVGKTEVRNGVHDEIVLLKKKTSDVLKPEEVKNAPVKLVNPFAALKKPTTSIASTSTSKTQPPASTVLVDLTIEVDNPFAKTTPKQTASVKKRKATKGEAKENESVANPFGVVKKPKLKETAVLFASKTAEKPSQAAANAKSVVPERDNPFLKSSANVNANEIKTETDFMSSTANTTSVIRPTFDVSVINAIVKNEDDGKKYKWFSKSLDKARCNDESGVWEDTNQSYRDSIVVRMRKFSLNRMPAKGVGPDVSYEKKGGKNFKRFSKASGVRRQTRVIPSTAFRKVYSCGTELGSAVNLDSE